MKKIVLLVCVLIAQFFLSLESIAEEEKILRVYTWYHYISQKVLDDFEKETGIKVHVDFYDSNEVLEAKLSTGASGYDLVFPSAWPYLYRQIPAGLYEPLDRTKIANLKLLDRDFMKKLETVDPQNNYVVPYLWGTSGFAFDAKKVKKIFKGELDSWAVIFDPKNVKLFDDNHCYVSLLEESVDIVPAVFAYLGLDPNSQKDEDLEKAAKVLRSVRPFIQKFQSSALVSDLANGEICVGQTWAGYANTAGEQAKEAGKDIDIVYVVPKEGAALTCDVMAIPINAPHRDNAHKFIDFMLRPENIAQSTNEFSYANAVPSSVKFVDKKILQNKYMYPTDAMRKKLYIDGNVSPEFERKRTRLLTDVKAGR